MDEQPFSMLWINQIPVSNCLSVAQLQNILKSGFAIPAQMRFAAYLFLNKPQFAADLRGSNQRPLDHESCTKQVLSERYMIANHD